MAHLQRTKKTHVSTALADEAMASQKSIVFVLMICLALLASRPVTGEISGLPPADLILILLYAYAPSNSADCALDSNCTLLPSGEG